MSDNEFVKILYKERHTLLTGASAAYREGINYSETQLAYIIYYIIYFILTTCFGPIWSYSGQ